MIEMHTINPVATALGTDLITDRLLANREWISLDRARVYLATRVRTRTPLGAAEFLEARSPRSMTGYDIAGGFAGIDWSRLYGKRVEIALDCLGIYRELFPDEYARSSAPYFSVQREHQFYRLVHKFCFPLLTAVDEDRAFPIVDFLEHEPGFVLPFIPVRGLQKHVWEPGGFDFDELALAYQLALSMCWGSEGDAAWEKVAQRYALPDGRATAPARPLGTVGWLQFCHTCAVEDSPARFLPMLFNAIGYRTGNTWLDLPRDSGPVPIRWTVEGVKQLSLQWAHANDFQNALIQLDNWLRENPRVRIPFVVGMWNAASRIELQSGYAGALMQDLIDDGAAAVLPGGGVMIAGELLDVPEEVEFLQI